MYSAENLEFNLLSSTGKLIYSAYPKNNLYRCLFPCFAQSRAHIPSLSFIMGLADNSVGQSISPNTQNGPNTPPNQKTPLLQTNSPMTRYTETPSPTPPPAEKRSAVLIIYATFLGMSLYPKGLIQLFTNSSAGVFIASADESLVISTYSTIASQFHYLSAGSWLLVAYNFGYCIALPVVCLMKASLMKHD